jgi:murein L,D-transpeptidase YafK
MKKILWLLTLMTICATVLLFAEKPKRIEKEINQTVDSLVVIKHQNTLMAFAKNKLIKTIDCGIGSNTKGHKQQQGDNRTPEGKYYITMRNDKSAYYKNLHINYPNEQDRKNCKARGVKTGGDIKIHGYADEFGKTYYRNTRYESTWGCVGVSNADMDELYKWVKNNAVILIKP